MEPKTSHRSELYADASEEKFGWAFLRVMSSKRLKLRRGTCTRAGKKMARLPGRRHSSTWSWPLGPSRMVLEGQAIGPSVSNAVLAALAIENGATPAPDRQQWNHPVPIRERREVKLSVPRRHAVGRR